MSARSKTVKSKNTPRSYMRKPLRRAMIVKAAIPVFAKKGFHGTTISDICKASGIAQGTLYLHFTNKLEIFHQIMKDFRDEVIKLMKPVLDVDDTDLSMDSSQAFNLIRYKVHQILQVSMENKEVIQITLRDAPGLAPEINKTMIDTYHAFLSIVETEVVFQRRVGMLRPVDPGIAAQTIVGNMIMIIFNNIIAEEGSYDLEYLVDQVMDIVFCGIGKEYKPSIE